MRCPIPSWTTGDYVIEGNEDALAPCNPQTDSTGWYFEFDVSGCNANVSPGTDGFDTYTATLVDASKTSSDGTFQFGGDPDLICSCRVYLEASGVASVELDADKETEYMVGEDGFDPLMVACSDSTFQETLTPDNGGSVTVTSDQFDMKIYSETTEDKIDVSHCVSRPAADPGADEIVVWDACNLGGVFEAGVYKPPQENQYWLSMRAFKYAGEDSGVKLTCMVERCSTLPCHDCNSFRRLESAGTEAASVTSQLRVGAQNHPMVMPGDLDEAALTTIYSAAGSGRLAAVRSVVFYNSPVSADPAFVASLAKTLEGWMDLSSRYEVIITTVATSTSGSNNTRRRLSYDGDMTISHAEAMLATFEAAPTATSNLAGAIAYLHAVIDRKSVESLAAAWGNELSSTWGIQAPNLIAEKVDAEGQPYNLEQEAAPAVLAPEASDDDINDDYSFIHFSLSTFAVALIVTIGVCTTCAGIIVGRYGRGMVFSTQKTPYTEGR